MHRFDPTEFIINMITAVLVVAVFVGMIVSHTGCDATGTVGSETKYEVYVASDTQYIRRKP